MCNSLLILSFFFCVAGDHVGRTLEHCRNNCAFRFLAAQGFGHRGLIFVICFVLNSKSPSLGRFEPKSGCLGLSKRIWCQRCCTNQFLAELWIPTISMDFFCVLCLGISFFQVFLPWDRLGHWLLFRSSAWSSKDFKLFWGLGPIGENHFEDLFDFMVRAHSTDRVHCVPQEGGQVQGWESICWGGAGDSFTWK